MMKKPVQRIMFKQCGKLTEMSYYNYHGIITQKIRNSELVKFKIVKQYGKISPAMLLFFCDYKLYPIREKNFGTYLSMIDKSGFCCDNNNMSITILHATPLKTNNYLICKDGTNILIEASADPQKVKEILNGEKLSAILLTHEHWDHILKLAEFLEIYPDVTLVVSKNATRYLTGEQKKFVKLPKSLPKNIILIDEKTNLKFGDIFIKALSTPGHSEGSVCYFLEDKCFSGDTLFKGTYGRCDLPGGDEEKMAQSLGKLFALEIDYEILPGHGDGSTLYIEKKNYPL